MLIRYYQAPIAVAMLLLTVSLTGCFEENVGGAYEAPAKVQFYPTSGSVEEGSGVQTLSAQLIEEGGTLSEDTKFPVTIVDSLTTTPDDTYELLTDAFVIPADSVFGEVRVDILSGSLSEGETATLTLGLQESVDGEVMPAENFRFFEMTITGQAGEGGQEQTANCEVTAPPSSLDINLDPFYDKYCSADGVPVVSDEVVPDAALEQTTIIITRMLQNLPDVKQEIISNDVRVGIIGDDQVTTDMPEHSDLDEAFPGTDWDERTRGVAATFERPLSSAGEENLLCYPDDPYSGESIMLHEFAHTIKQMGIDQIDGSFDNEVQEAYDNALAEGLWSNTYAGGNVAEYWAEGVQSYFNANLESDPADGVHNHVNTRGELQEYDPMLYNLTEAQFGNVEWTYSCPSEHRV